MPHVVLLNLSSNISAGRIETVLARTLIRARDNSNMLPLLVKEGAFGEAEGVPFLTNIFM
jgi:hypothetical protein